MVPAGARGEAMGLHGSAITTGMAIGGPMAGAVIDAMGPAWGFVVSGLAGMVLALAALPWYRGRFGTAARRRSGEPTGDLAQEETTSIAAYAVT